MDINIYHHLIDSTITINKLDEILKVVKMIQKEEKIMSAELIALQAAVAENAALDDSIILLVEGLAAQIVALKDDPIALTALATEIKAKSAALSAAIQANTPAPPPEPTPEA